MKSVNEKFVELISVYESLECFARKVFGTECIIEEDGTVFFVASGIYATEQQKQILINAIVEKQAIIDARQARIEDHARWQVPQTTAVHDIGTTMVRSYGRLLAKQFHEAIMRYDHDEYGKGLTGICVSMTVRQQWIDAN